MEMHNLPFKPRTLTLAIAASLLASQPVSKVNAEDRVQPDNEWNCSSDANGQWDCNAIPRQYTPVKRASLPRAASGAAVTTATPGTGINLKSTLDWQPLAQLTPSKRAQQPYYSCGAYIEPARPGIDFKGDANSAPIVAEANDSEYSESDIATLTGDVRIRQGNRQLESDLASLDRQKNYAEFQGNVRFREPGVLLVGERGDLQMDSGRATLEDTVYVMHEGKVRGSASKIVRNEDATLNLSDATYTTCPPGDKGWLLSGENVSIDQATGEGVARNAVVRIQGLPVFYTPYLSFPLDDRRKSGFLYPTIGQDSDNGFDTSIPYYWNIAPDYDATFTPRYMSNRGVLLENEFRYLAGNHTGEVGVSGLLNKDKLEEENPYYDQERWLVNLRHFAQLTGRWKAQIDYADASDKNYLKDFGTSLNLSGKSPLDQKLSTQYLGGNIDHSWQVKLNAHKYKNMSLTTNDPYNKLPQLELTGNWHGSDRLNINYIADYTKFSRDDDWNFIREKYNSELKIKQSIYEEGYGINEANGDRIYLESGANYPMEWTYAFLKPAVKVQHVQYNLTNLNKDEVINDFSSSYGDSFNSEDYTETPKTTVPVVSIDGGMYFDRSSKFGNTLFTHTLEPRLKYLYSPYVEGQEMNPVFDSSQLAFNYNSLWRDSRFSGYDRLGDANQLSIGLTSRLIENDGYERARFGIGQIVYFRDRKLWISPTAGSKSDDNPEADWENNLTDEENRLRNEMQDSTSPIATEMVYNFTRTMSVRQDLMWDARENQLDNYGIYYAWRPDARKVFNIGYRYREQATRFVKDSNNNNIIDLTDPTGYKTADNNLSEADVSFAWPLVDQFSALGRMQYDLTNNRNLERLLGVEYNSCCYQVRLVWRSWVKEDSTNIDYPEQKSGIFLQFVLRGLGGLSSGSFKDSLNGIKGYTVDEK